MTSTLLQPETHGLDAASFARITNFEPVKAAGAKWLSFYIGGNYGIGRTQLEAAWRAGLPVMPNFERAGDAARGGYDVGRAHAQTAKSQLTNLGFLGECPVIFSGVDFSPRNEAELKLCDQYHLALVETWAGNGWIGGAYGPRSALQRLAGYEWWPDFWPLWHWGGDGFTRYPWAWCKQWYGLNQTPVDSLSLGYAVDENTLLKPMRFWSGYGADHLEPDVKPLPPPAPPLDWKDDDMPVMYRTDDAIHWPGSSTLAAGDYPPGQFITFTLTGEGKVRHLPATETQLYLRRGVPITVVTGMEIKHLIDDGGGVHDPTGD